MSKDIGGCDYETVLVAMQYIYLGHIDDDKQQDKHLVTRLMELSDFLQMTSLVHASKMLMHKHLAAKWSTPVCLV